MSKIEAIAGRILVQVFRHRYFKSRRNVFTNFLIFLSALLCMAGISFFFLAWYEWLDSSLPHIHALVATAAFALFLSLLAMLMSKIILKKKSHCSQANEQTIQRVIENLSAPFGTNLEKSIQDNPKSFIIAVIAGLLWRHKPH